MNLSPIEDFENYHDFEIIRADFIDGQITNSLNLSNKHFFVCLDDHIYKMVEIGDNYQITYYSRYHKRKGMMVVNKKTFLPLEYEETLYGTLENGRKYSGYKRQYDFEIKYTISPDKNCKIVYETENGKFSLKSIENTYHFENWKIKRYNKFDETKSVDKIFSKINANFKLSKMSSFVNAKH